MERFVWKTKNATVEFKNGLMTYHNEQKAASSVQDVAYFYYTMVVEVRNRDNITRRVYDTHDYPKAWDTAACVKAMVDFDTKNNGYSLRDDVDEHHMNKAYYHQMEHTNFGMYTEYFLRYEKYHYEYMDMQKDAKPTEHINYKMTIGSVPDHCGYLSEVCDAVFFNQLSEQDLLGFAEAAENFTQYCIQEENARIAHDDNTARIEPRSSVFLLDTKEKKIIQVGCMENESFGVEETMKPYFEKYRAREDESLWEMIIIASPDDSDKLDAKYCAWLGKNAFEKELELTACPAPLDVKLDFFALLYGHPVAFAADEAQFLSNLLNADFWWDKESLKRVLRIDEKICGGHKTEASFTKEELVFLQFALEVADCRSTETVLLDSLMAKIVEAK